MRAGLGIVGIRNFIFCCFLTPHLHPRLSSFLLLYVQPPFLQFPLFILYTSDRICGAFEVHISIVRHNRK